MKSEWKTTSNMINGKWMYRIYRLIDKDDVDHSGNREYAGEYIKDESMANAACKALNRLEVK